jgi:hypothetical protein
VPGLEQTRIKYDKLEETWSSYKALESGETEKRDSIVKGSGVLIRDGDGSLARKPRRGLNILLYTAYHAKKDGYTRVSTRILTRDAEASSDYSPVPFTDNNMSGEGFSMFGDYEDLIDYVPYINQGINRNLYSKGSFLHWMMQDSRLVDDVDFNAYLRELKANQYLLSRKVYFVSTSIHPRLKYDVEKLWRAFVNIHPVLYGMVSCLAKWEFPRTVSFKVINPGEQMTGTFHRIVLSDPVAWYRGEYYDTEGLCVDSMDTREE